MSGVAFTIPAGVLHAAADWAAKAAPSKAAVPILQGVLVEAGVGCVTLSGFDFDRCATVTVDAFVSTCGRALLPARLFAGVAGAAGKGVDVRVDTTSGVAKVVAGQARWSIPVMPVEDYPQLPDVPLVAGSVGSGVFSEAVAQVAVAAGKDDTLPMLTGIRLEIEGTRLTMAATDRFRLAVRELVWEPGDIGLSTAVLVPARTLAEAAKALTGRDVVELALSGKDGMLGLSGAGRKLTTRLLDAEFPKYRQLLPENHVTVVKIGTAVLSEAIKRVSLMADRSSQVQMEFRNDELRLTASDDGGDAEEMIPCELEGDSMTIAFNSSYVLDALDAVRVGCVSFGFTLPNRPALVRPAPVGPDLGVDYQHLLMPVRIPG